MAQQQYTLMKTKSTFIKSQMMEHEIVAMRAEIRQLKGKLILSKMWNRQALRRPEVAPTSSARREMRHGRRSLPSQTSLQQRRLERRTFIGANTTWHRPCIIPRIAS